MKLDKEELEEHLKEMLSQAQEVKAIYYRIVRSNYRDAIISGAGAKVYPGRWMQVGICYVLYASSSIETAYNEIVRNRKSFKHQYVLALLDVNCSKVLNLTSAKILKQLGLRKKDLFAPFDPRRKSEENITQLIGRIAFKTGFKGLIVPSAVHKDGENLVLFSSKTPIPNVKIIEKREFRA